MPCKHEGGTDPCVRYVSSGTNRKCKVAMRQYNRNCKSSGFGNRNGSNAGDVGEAGELLVAVDLLKRGLQVTKPVNRAGKDDLHAKCSHGWISIQSKVSAVNRKTGSILNSRRGSVITSDVIAWVDLAGMRIRYESNTAEPLPVELI